ncbi:SDR family NAD(P)-dependent oxidoreductase [Chengkuizengella axinellae]|uniref:SDR family NAD(P)-dependent oxidoreductase n=1 Tax=Chengkuizengella axinellae TaxID=3064388 RepID=A0ABT9J4C0_9BACL|nr:SDR family NAD(P)-dependent oxidoreductase [Chengkuizengella sp. 2205SS18-9]MDP5276440.1 SDR family NAD(P)-dependent oxidoreductase [Chengkuizengella sp. 2205SS18-9]
MDNKTCLITGANAGIGKAAAIQIAKKGYHVILACRNKEKGEEALKDVKLASNSESIELMLVDMSLQSSIKDMVKQFRAKYNKLDILINNAAFFDISQKEAKLTNEGIESVWATNHLGPVLLTQLLLEPLMLSPQGRVITISSKGLIVHPLIQVQLEDPQFRARKFNVSKAYYQSKIAQVMYTYWLAEKLKNTKITVNCIRVTNVKLDINRYPNLSKLAKFAYSIKSKSSISPEEMAKTYTYLATSEEVIELTGKYFDENNKWVDSSKYSNDFENINKVMDLTMKCFKNSM